MIITGRAALTMSTYVASMRYPAGAGRTGARTASEGNRLVITRLETPHDADSIRDTTIRPGLESCSDVTYPGVPADNTVCLVLGDETPSGEIRHHPAFDVSPME